MAHLNFPSPDMAAEGKVGWCWNVRLKKVFNFMRIARFTWATARMGLFCNSAHRSVKNLSMCLTSIT